MPPFGWKPSKETIDKLSLSHIGHVPWNKGKICKNISRTKSGMIFSEEHREHLCAAQKKRFEDPEQRALMKIYRSLRVSKHNGIPTYEHRSRIAEAHVGGFWYGNVRHTTEKNYCEKWNKDFRKRCRLWNSYHHGGIVVCIGCGTTTANATTLKGGFHVHHVYYDKKACCAISNNSKYFSNLGIKNNPYTFEIIGDPNKFVCLCASCHAKTLRNREYWARHYEKIVNANYAGKSYFTVEEWALLNPQTLLPIPSHTQSPA